MKRQIRTLSAVIALAGTLLAGSASAFNFGNMMNPSKWMNDNDDDYYADDYYGGPGYYGPPPGYYGGPAYAPGYGGYGAPGYGVPAYSTPGSVPGYGGAYNAPSGAYGPDHDLPDTHSSYERNRDKEEIARLKERIRKLEEAGHQAAPPAPAPAYGNSPGYQGAPPAYGTQSGYGYSAPATPQAGQAAGQPAWNDQAPYRYRQE